MKHPAPLLVAALLALASCAHGAGNFEVCLRAAADAWAREYDTSIRFVDPWHKRSEDQQYPYWVDKSTRNGDFYNVNVSPPRPDIAFDSLQTNDACTTTNTFHFTKEFTHTNTFSLALTDTLAIEESLEVSVSIPEVGGIKDTTKITASISSTQTSTASDTSMWAVAEDIPIAPREQKQITAVVSSEDFAADFDYYVDFSGYVPMWFESKIDFNRPPGQGSDFHWLWFLPVSGVLDKGISTGNATCSGFTAYPPRFMGHGHVSGVMGINVAVNTVSTKLSPCTTATAFASGATTVADAPLKTQTLLVAPPQIEAQQEPAPSAPGPKSQVFNLPQGARAFAAPGVSGSGGGRRLK